MDRDHVRFIGPEGITEVQGGFDLEGYVAMRAEQERQRAVEIYERYGDNPPTGVFNPMFVWADIYILVDFKTNQPELFVALAQFLRDPSQGISDEQAAIIMRRSSMMLQRQEDGSYKAGQRIRATFRETEASGGFEGFLDKAKEYFEKGDES